MRTTDGEVQPVLVGTQGTHAGRRFPVHEDGLLLGRDATCDVVIDDAGVSREHARVLLHNEAVWVQDLGSRNGCSINGRRLTRHKQLGPGDTLEVGAHAFTLELADPFGDQESVSTFGAAPPTADALEQTAALPTTAQAGSRGLLLAGVAVVVVVLTGVAWLVLGGG